MNKRAENTRCCRLKNIILHKSVIIFCELMLLGCAPNFAPPARIDHSGAPGRQKRGNFGVETVIGVAPDSQSDAGDTEIGGTLLASYGINEKFAIQTGYQFTPDAWHMAVLGIRYTPFPPNLKKPLPDFLLDLEVGQGLGVGGVKHEKNPDDDESYEVGDPFKRFAVGVYCGFGIGLGLRIVDIFIRARVQYVKAIDLETTVWVSGAGGIQLNLPYGVRLYSAVGGGFYYNDEDQGNLSFPIGGLIVEGGISYHFQLVHKN